MAPGRANRGKDGMLTRFTQTAMDDIVKLVPDFGSETEATKFLAKVTNWKRVKDMATAHCEAPFPEYVVFSSSYYRCTSPLYVSRAHGMELPARTRTNPMEVLHRLAHYLQPSDSKWHGGEFGSTFLDLVERTFGADKRREVKNIMVENRLKTSVRSEESRLRQSQRYYDKKVGEMPSGLMDILRDIQGIADE